MSLSERLGESATDLLENLLDLLIFLWVKPDRLHNGFLLLLFVWKAVHCFTVYISFLFFFTDIQTFFYATFLNSTDLPSLVSHLWWNNQWFIQSGLLVLHTFSALRVCRRIANNFTSSVWLRSGFCTVCTSVPDQSMTCFASFHRPTPQNHIPYEVKRQKVNQLTLNAASAAVLKYT